MTPSKKKKSVWGTATQYFEQPTPPSWERSTDEYETKTITDGQTKQATSDHPVAI